MSELEPCPTCGALPCDWVDNPHTRQPNPADLIEGARRFKRLALNALTLNYADNYLAASKAILALDPASIVETDQ